MQCVAIAARHRHDPGFQFIEVEGPDQIVVGATVPPIDPVGNLIERTDDYDGRRILEPAQALQEFDAASVRQQQIEKDQPVLDRISRRNGVRYNTHPVHGVE